MDKKIFEDINKERQRQNAKWGDQSATNRFLMLTVLGEEYGEVCKAAMEEGPNSQHYREELIHVAPVAVQLIEHFDGVPQ